MPRHRRGFDTAEAFDHLSRRDRKLGTWMKKLGPIEPDPRWRKAFDPVDEIARHTGSEIPPPDEQPDLRHPGGEIDRGLPCRIAGTHERHLLAGAQLPFQRRGPVVHA